MPVSRASLSRYPPERDACCPHGDRESPATDNRPALPDTPEERLRDLQPAGDIPLGTAESHGRRSRYLVSALWYNPRSPVDSFPFSDGVPHAQNKETRDRAATRLLCR